MAVRPPTWTKTEGANGACGVHEDVTDKCRDLLPLLLHICSEVVACRNLWNVQMSFGTWSIGTWLSVHCKCLLSSRRTAVVLTSCVFIGVMVAFVNIALLSIVFCNK